MELGILKLVHSLAGSMRELPAQSNIEFVKTAIKGIMDEIALVARTSGVHTGSLLGDEATDILRRTEHSDFKPSMLVDLEANRSIEVEVILGEIVRKAAEFGVPVPRLQTIYTSLKGHSVKTISKPEVVKFQWGRDAILSRYVRSGLVRRCWFRRHANDVSTRYISYTRAFVHEAG